MLWLHPDVPAGLCPHHVSSEAGWSAENRRANDALLRGRWLRLPLTERERFAMQAGSPWPDPSSVLSLAALEALFA